MSSPARSRMTTLPALALALLFLASSGHCLEAYGVPLPQEEEAGIVRYCRMHPCGRRLLQIELRAGPPPPAPAGGPPIGPAPVIGPPPPPGM